MAVTDFNAVRSGIRVCQQAIAALRYQRNVTQSKTKLHGYMLDEVSLYAVNI